jgi:carbonic anhydrase/acetyltransferase-like protein (isoleucine patch superfamily)
MIIEFEGIMPKIGANVFVASTAAVIGEVEILENANIWFGAVLRGDMAPIVIGRNTNIQDNCTVHTDVDSPAHIGDNVTVGHNAVVHGCAIENNCLIGIGAIVLSGAQIKEGSIVAAGSVVTEGQQIGPYQLVTGVPAKGKKVLSKSLAGELPQSVKNYLKLAVSHMKSNRDNI